MTGRNKDNEPASTAPPASGDEDGIAEDLFSDGRRDELRRLLEMAARKRDEAARAAAARRAGRRPCPAPPREAAPDPDDGA